MSVHQRILQKSKQAQGIEEENKPSPIKEKPEEQQEPLEDPLSCPSFLISPSTTAFPKTVAQAKENRVPLAAMIRPYGVEGGRFITNDRRYPGV